MVHPKIQNVGLDSHVGAELVEVPVAILLHFLWRVDGQGAVGVHGDHHAADVRLQGGTVFNI